MLDSVPNIFISFDKNLKKIKKIKIMEDLFNNTLLSDITI